MTTAAPDILRGRGVLVVEDQFLIADEMCRVIVALGGTVIGPAPTLAATRRLLGAGAPDLAVLDINLGSEQVWPVAQELRALGVPLVFATGYEVGGLDPAFRSELHVEKPVTAKVLAAAVQKLSLPPLREFEP